MRRHEQSDTTMEQVQSCVVTGVTNTSASYMYVHVNINLVQVVLRVGHTLTAVRIH